MKKNLITLLLIIPLSVCAQTAKIKIDVERSIGEIDPKIYGVFKAVVSLIAAPPGNLTDPFNLISMKSIAQKQRKSRQKITSYPVHFHHIHLHRSKSV